MIRINIVNTLRPKVRRIMQNILKVSNRIKGESLAKILILIVTGSGLFYQARIIFQQFISGKTVVRLEIGSFQDKTPPAITVCLPTQFSMERTANISAKYTEMYENYTKLLKNNSNKANHIYWKFFEPYTLDRLKNNGLDLKLLFDKMSFKYKTLDGKYNIKFILNGYLDDNILHGEFLIKNNKDINQYIFIGDPLESIFFLSKWKQIGKYRIF